VHSLLNDDLFLPPAVDEDELPDYIQQRRNQDLLAPGSQTWGPELLGFCQQADLLILNGRTPGDEYGQFTFQNAKGCCSTIDYFVASAQCFSAVKSLHVLHEAARYRSDHNLLLHIAYKARLATHTLTPHLQHQMPELDMMFRRLKHIKRLLQLSCSNTSFHSFSKSSMLMSCVTSLKHA